MTVLNLIGHSLMEYTLDTKAVISLLRMKFKIIAKHVIDSRKDMLCHVTVNLQKEH